MSSSQKTGKGVAAAAVLPVRKAEVIQMPGAAPASVVQQRRRGRLPRAVSNINTERWERSVLARRVRLKAQLDLVHDQVKKQWQLVDCLEDELKALKARIAAETGAAVALTRVADDLKLQMGLKP